VRYSNPGRESRSDRLTDSLTVGFTARPALPRATGGALAVSAATATAAFSAPLTPSVRNVPVAPSPCSSQKTSVSRCAHHGGMIVVPAAAAAAEGTPRPLRGVNLPPRPVRGLRRREPERVPANDAVGKRRRREDQRRIANLRKVGRARVAASPLRRLHQHVEQAVHRRRAADDYRSHRVRQRIPRLGSRAAQRPRAHDGLAVVVQRRFLFRFLVVLLGPILHAEHPRRVESRAERAALTVDAAATAPALLAYDVVAHARLVQRGPEPTAV